MARASAQGIAVGSARVRSVVATSDAMARAGGAMFFAGGVLGAIVAWQIDVSRAGSAMVGYVVAAVSIVLGLFVLVVGTRFGPAVYPPLVTAATLLITTIVYKAPTDVTAVALASFYVSVACAAFFFTWVQAAAQIAFAAVCCIAVFYLRSDSQWWAGLVVAGMIVAIGIVVGLMGRVVADGEVDPLTGLLNRTGFEAELRLANSRAIVARRGPAVIVLDVDRVGASQDVYSDHARRTLLQQIAHSWLDHLGPKFVLARYDTDRFAVLGRAISEQDAVELAEGLCAAVPSGCSAGVTSGRRGESVDAVLGRAELALSRAGRVGHRRTVLESSGLPPLVIQLADAIAADSFDLRYQPIVNLADGCVVGVEALLRWRPPTRPEMTPIEVIRVAEQTNHIAELGRAVMRRACRDAMTLQQASDRPLTLNVNVSGLELVRPGYAAGVLDILVETGWPAGRLVIEVTESVLDADKPSAVDVLHRLRAKGIRIAIDDFGSGYSSLSRIRDLPFDFIKLDATFTSAIPYDSAVTPLLQAVAAIGIALDVPVLAEGVETPQQAAVLTSLGFTLGQGFHYGHPQPVAAIAGKLGGEGSGIATTRPTQNPSTSSR